MKRTGIVLLLAMACTGCFRTVYSHLTPSVAERAATTPQPHERDAENWQHFFLYGWVPSEKVIDAAFACGGVEHVRRIETEQSFAQGLVATFAGYYINIYSPYTGHVVCDDAGGR